MSGLYYSSTCGDKLFEGDFEISWLTGGGRFFYTEDGSIGTASENTRR